MRKEVAGTGPTPEKRRIITLSWHKGENHMGKRTTYLVPEGKYIILLLSISYYIFLNRKQSLGTVHHHDQK